MSCLTEAGRVQMVSLLRQIMQHNPPIQTLDMGWFSEKKDKDENICQLVIETLLNTNIESITDLRLDSNESWFRHPET